MKINIAGYLPTTCVNGPGVRLAVFTQGCPHACKGCHNPDTHSFSGGHLIDTSEIIDIIRRRGKLLDGITLTGGEPFCQAEACKEIADAAHREGLSVWCYTGYTWAELVAHVNPPWEALLESVDVLVDGPYIEEWRTLNLPWRGSRNQRLIDVRKSLQKPWLVEVRP